MKLLNLREGRFADCNQILAGGSRAALRRGEDYPQLQREGPQKGILVTVPLFHVTGSTSFSVGTSNETLHVIYELTLDDGNHDGNEDHSNAEMGN